MLMLALLLKCRGGVFHFEVQRGKLFVQKSVVRVDVCFACEKKEKN
jgi:hypothetical protein